MRVPIRVPASGSSLRLYFGLELLNQMVLLGSIFLTVFLRCEV